MNLRVEHVSWSAGNRPIVDDVCLSVESGECVGLLGPNGSGKSTLLRCIYRLLKPRAGSVRLGERDLLALSPREAAREIAVVLQETALPFDFTVREMVFMGRTPYKAPFDGDTAEDWAIVETALRQVGLGALAERRFNTLSGGEKQRVLLARALAQQTRFLILDEPTSHLDIRYQLELLDLIRRLRLTTLVALHDLNLAAAYCDRLYVMKAGRVVAAGRPDEVLTTACIRDVYGVAADVAIHPRTGRPHVTYIQAHIDKGQPS